MIIDRSGWMKKNNKSSNRLINEKSPYLQQHAHNPVDWYPWGEEAFEEARKKDKPIFLSIGYSTCHWCHVMERECFDNREVADLLNDVCVPIKVDREERPDLDGNFMAVCQVMNNGGGWPLNVFLTPEGKPFFAGTYIPRETRGQVPGMLDMLPRIKWLWSTQKEQILNSAAGIVESLQKGSALPPGNIPGKQNIDACFEDLLRNFDEEWGGFYSYPKFPMPGILMFLLQHWQEFGDVRALDMVEKTLTSMSLGGIHDHLGGGFHRYSTDRKWLLPHFEKMLYDQALLMVIYTRAFQVTGDDLFRRTLEGIVHYVGSVLTSPEGAFYSAEDADSEGIEGLFYTWSAEEIQHILGEESAPLLDLFNVESAGNFRDEASGAATGKNILFLNEKPDEAVLDSVHSSRMDLLKARNKRQRPFRDEKILTDWNGMMIAALAMAGRILGNEDYISKAEKAMDFFLSRMTTPDGKLLHRYIDGEAVVDGFLDDYAFMIWGMLELFRANGREELLNSVFQLLGTMTDLFWDEENGGFYSTEKEAADLFFRRKEAYDGAILSANSVAVSNFVHLAELTGKEEFTSMAEVVSRAFGHQVDQLPSSHSYLLASVMKMQK